jgi:hypothetical protein
VEKRAILNVTVQKQCLEEDLVVIVTLDIIKEDTETEKAEKELEDIDLIAEIIIATQEALVKDAEEIEAEIEAVKEAEETGPTKEDEALVEVQAEEDTEKEDTPIHRAEALVDDK